MHRLQATMLVQALLLSGVCAAEPPLLDADRDGLDDRFEQQLLEKFVPRFYLSAQDCDGSPAEFRPGTAHPEVLARNGTIYGQVFPVRSKRLTGRLIEIHFFHLWGRDCGRVAHNLDAEQVMMLAHSSSEGKSPSDWKARFWYAAAHENTVCDFSNAAKPKTCMRNPVGRRSGSPETSTPPFSALRNAIRDAAPMYVRTAACWNRRGLSTSGKQAPCSTDPPGLPPGDGLCWQN